ncbi:MAG: DUF4830 domain-containing protein, partial [Peptostreptococcaceae bacterium]
SIFIVMFSIVGCSSTSVNEKVAEVVKEVKGNNEDLASQLKNTVKIEVYHDYHNNIDNNYKSEIVTDQNIINDFISYIRLNAENAGKTTSGVAVNNKIIFYDKDNNAKTLNYVYDDLYEFGYILDNQNRYDLPYDFFRLLAATEEYRVDKANISEDVKRLFNKYKYSPSFMISSETMKLPSDLKYGYDENVDKIYWAASIELSKAIGMDFSNLLSQEITAEIYYLLQPLPSFCKPYTEARGVVIKYKGEIVGAYIQGNNNTMVSSLNKQSFEQITYMSMNDWLVKNVLDKDSELYKESSKMSDEQLIKVYYESMANGNYKKQLSTMDMNSIVNSIMSNTSTSLFTKNIKESVPNYISKLEIIDINESENDGNNYHVEMDIISTKEASVEKGKQIRTVMMANVNGLSKIKEEVPGPQ